MLMNPANATLTLITLRLNQGNMREADEFIKKSHMTSYILVGQISVTAYRRRPDPRAVVDRLP
jgi:hypothetical protein